MLFEMESQLHQSQEMDLCIDCRLIRTFTLQLAYSYHASLWSTCLKNSNHPCMVINGGCTGLLGRLSSFNVSDCPFWLGLAPAQAERLALPVAVVHPGHHTVGLVSSYLLGWHRHACGREIRFSQASKPLRPLIL